MECGGSCGRARRHGGVDAGWSVGWWGKGEMRARCGIVGVLGGRGELEFDRNKKRAGD